MTCSFCIRFKNWVSFVVVIGTGWSMIDKIWSSVWPGCDVWLRGLTHLLPSIHRILSLAKQIYLLNVVSLILHSCLKPNFWVFWNETQFWKAAVLVCTAFSGIWSWEEAASEINEQLLVVSLSASLFLEIRTGNSPFPNMIPTGVCVCVCDIDNVMSDRCNHWVYQI